MAERWSKPLYKYLSNSLVIIMDIRVKPEYNDSLLFLDLIRESKKYLIILAWLLKIMPQSMTFNVRSGHVLLGDYLKSWSTFRTGCTNMSTQIMIMLNIFIIISAKDIVNRLCLLKAMLNNHKAIFF